MSKQDLPPIPDQAAFLETLSPQSIGVALMQSFDGYDTGDHVPLPMQYLLQRYYLCPSYDGDPVFTLRSPKEGDAIAPWSYNSRSFHPSTTDKSTPDSPHIVPEDVKNADTIVTVTDTHHYYLATATQDMIFAPDEHDRTLRAYWYTKHPEDGVPQPMISLDPVRNLLQHQPKRWYIGARIELWTPTNTVDRDSENIIRTSYQLQAGYALKGLSLVNYLAFLSLDPQIFNKSTDGRISLTE